MIFQGAMLGAGDQHQGLPSGPSAGNETLQPISLSFFYQLLPLFQKIATFRYLNKYFYN